MRFLGIDPGLRITGYACVELRPGAAEPALVEALFDAAAKYYRAAPWVQLSNMQALAIQIAPDTEPRYAVVMGNGGVEYGLALYKQWDDFLLQFELVDHPLERLPKDILISASAALGWNHFGM